MFQYKDIQKLVPKTSPRWKLPIDTLLQQKVWYSERYACWVFRTFAYPDKTMLRDVTTDGTTALALIRDVHFPLVLGPDSWDIIGTTKKDDLNMLFRRIDWAASEARRKLKCLEPSAGESHV